MALTTWLQWKEYQKRIPGNSVCKENKTNPICYRNKYREIQATKKNIHTTEHLTSNWKGNKPGVGGFSTSTCKLWITLSRRLSLNFKARSFWIMTGNKFGHSRCHLVTACRLQAFEIVGDLQQTNIMHATVCYCNPSGHFPSQIVCTLLYENFKPSNATGHVRCAILRFSVPSDVKIVLWFSAQTCLANIRFKINIFK